MSDLDPPPLDPATTNGPTPCGPTDPQPPAPASTAASAPTSSAAPPPKRQRRPSVRLGDIGEQPASSDPYLHRHRSKQPFKLPPPPSSAAGVPATKNNSSSSAAAAATKPRTLSLHHPNTSPDENGTNLETLAASIHSGRNPNPKFPKRRRKIRSGWTSSKPEEDEEEDEGFRSEFDDLRRDDSLSPQAGPLSEADGGGRDWNEENHKGNIGLDEDGGVRSWLNRLGLGRYAPVFEIHEVDDEVLPLLTLEDLKDMGINAVGSRRKVYCAIQKLKKNFYLESFSLDVDSTGVGLACCHLSLLISCSILNSISSGAKCIFEHNFCMLLTLVRSHRLGPLCMQESISILLA